MLFSWVWKNLWSRSCYNTPLISIVCLVINLLYWLNFLSKKKRTFYGILTDSEVLYLNWFGHYLFLKANDCQHLIIFKDNRSYIRLPEATTVYIRHLKVWIHKYRVILLWLTMSTSVYLQIVYFIYQPLYSIILLSVDQLSKDNPIIKKGYYIYYRIHN